MARFSWFLIVKFSILYLILISTHRSQQESSTPFKDPTSHPSDLKELSPAGQGTSRPLPTLSSCQSMAATDMPVCSLSLASSTNEPQELPDPRDAPREGSFRLDGNQSEFGLGNSLPASPLHSCRNLEKEESELHLYIISATSSIFLHLKSSWNNYIIVSDLDLRVFASGFLFHFVVVLFFRADTLSCSLSPFWELNVGI